jgi:hypothetical protein
MVVIEASGHCPHTSHPDLTLAATREYIGGGSAPQRPT